MEIFNTRFFFTLYLYVLYLFLNEDGGRVSGYAENDDVDTDYIVPPKDKDMPYPLMLHERDVIHYVDTNKEFVQIASGTFANITLGELRDSGVPVIMKKFKSSSFYDILHEVRVHRYVQYLGFTPLLIGLLPTGPMGRNVSVVYEFIDNAKNLYDWVYEFEPFSDLQWLQICHELTLNLQELHRHHVLFNDLHRKNIVIQKRDGKVKTYIIDFGLSTYQTGKLYKHGEESLYGYKYLAPELVNYTYTSEAADVYAVGYILQKITDEQYPEPELQNLAHWCMSRDPKDRPELPEVIARIERIYFEKASFCRLGSFDSNLCPEPIRYKYLNKEVNTTGRSPDISDGVSGLKDRIHVHKTVSANLGNINGYLDCRVSLPVMTYHDFVTGMTEQITESGPGRDDALRLAVLKDGNRTVIVKDFYDVNYEEIREEACVTMYLSHKGIAPAILGIAIDYRRLSDIAVVQEYFGQGVTLLAFATLTTSFDWDTDHLKRVARGELTYGDVNIWRKDVCQGNRKGIFLSILIDFTRPVCKAKSYRQMIMENISIQIISYLQMSHESGMLVNNLRLENIIIRWNPTKRGQLLDWISSAIHVRLIDLGAVTSLTKGITYDPIPLIDNKHTYLAPEVVLGQRTSVESDVYSACVIVRALMLNYFSTNDEAMEFQRFRTFLHQIYSEDCDLVSCPSKHTRPRNRKYLKLSADSDYSRLQRLLLKCLHESHALRPSTGEIIQQLADVQSNHYDGLWL